MSGVPNFDFFFLLKIVFIILNINYLYTGVFHHQKLIKCTCKYIYTYLPIIQNKAMKISLYTYVVYFIEKISKKKNKWPFMVNIRNYFSI